MLNEDLAEAIALGHDLGHAPFGHAGESILNELCEEGFRHNEQSVRTVTVIEKKGRGLNLSAETLDGMLCHTGGVQAKTLEGRVVHYADRIAYINHDIDDAVRAGILDERDIPGDLRAMLGHSTSERINTVVHAILSASADLPDVAMPAEVERAMNRLRDFMFERVYRNPVAKGEERKAREILEMLYSHYIAHTDELPADYRTPPSGEERHRAVSDYIAGMTDRYAVTSFREIYIPKGWQTV